MTSGGSLRYVTQQNWFPLMPRKIRELIRDLEKAGFIDRGGKGNHRNFEHPRGMRVVVSGNPGDDVKPYQEKVVMSNIEESLK